MAEQWLILDNGFDGRGRAKTDRLVRNEGERGLTAKGLKMDVIGANVKMMKPPLGKVNSKFNTTLNYLNIKGEIDHASHFYSVSEDFHS